MPAPTTRTRTFNGCDTCRRRHVRCDTTRPSCLRCTKLGLKCGGYEKNAVFGLQTPLGSQNIQFRRPISSEQERQQMSDQLANEVGLYLAVRYIHEIEQDCESTPLATKVDISRGPFSVFHSRPSTEEGDLESVKDPDRSSSDTSQQAVEEPADLGHLSPTTEALIATISGQSDQFDFLPFEDWVGSSPVGRVEELFDLAVAPDQLAFAESPAMPLWQHDSVANVGSPLGPGAASTATFPVRATVSSEDVHLLSHYTNSVVGLLTPFRHTKTPWHILLIPHVKSCLAAFALNEPLDHASLCIFHGTLTLSASSLNGLSSGDTWAECSEQHKQQTLQHARLMLRTAYDVPKTAKYKTILMALITVIQVSIFSATDPGPYFLEAEKFIRLKGLKRRKSRKVRLLHHCYVFERLFYESTSVAGSDPAHQKALTKAVASSGIVVNGQDSPGFRLPSLASLERSLQRLKGQEEGENDLHLAFPGDFPGTMYPEVVAVTEGYMVLLSLIVRLGKAKDTAGQLPADFLTHSKSLERAILRLKPTIGERPSMHSGVQANEKVLGDMRLAMHEALLLYFYRRIYDVDASLLQGRARTICECLLRCEAADAQSLYGSTGFRWPAFIAACETEELDVQESFALLFRRLAQRSGLFMFISTLQQIEQVWYEKQKGGVVSTSWLDLMKRQPKQAL